MQKFENGSAGTTLAVAVECLREENAGWNRWLPHLESHLSIIRG
jgi:hypothetical protein